MSPREQDELGYAIQDAKASYKAAEKTLNDLAEMGKEHAAFVKKWEAHLNAMPGQTFAHLQTAALWLREETTQALINRNKAGQRVNILMGQMAS